MSKIKNGGLDQYGAGPFEQQQFGTAGVEGVKAIYTYISYGIVYRPTNNDRSNVFRSLKPLSLRL